MATHATIPLSVLAETGAELRTYVALAGFVDEHGDARVSLAELAAVAGIAKPTVRDHLHALEDAGHVAAAPQFDASGKQVKSLYRLVAIGVQEIPTPAPETDSGGLETRTPYAGAGAYAGARSLRDDPTNETNGAIGPGLPGSFGEAVRPVQPADAVSRTDRARAWALERTDLPGPLPTLWRPNRAHLAALRGARERGVFVSERALRIAFDHAAEGRASSNWGAELLWSIRLVVADILGEQPVPGPWRSSELDYAEDIHDVLPTYYHALRKEAVQ